MTLQWFTPLSLPTLLSSLNDDGRWLHRPKGFQHFPLWFSHTATKTGTDGDDILIGGFGNTTLCGKAGRDLLIDLWGNNQLLGGDGDDRLWSGFGDDFLDGGPGTNRIFGGFGQDTFVLKNDGRLDTIFDFVPGVDRFLLQGGLTFAQLAITQQGADAAIRYLGQTAPSVILRNVQSKLLFAQDFQTQALAPTFSSLTIFGDSLSDPGNLFDLTQAFSSVGFPSPPYSDGRFSNGDLWVDYLAEQIGLEATSIQNFAFGGAMTGTGNGLEALLGADLPGLANEIDTYLSSLGAEGTADPNGLYVVWAGANDLFNLPANPADIPTFLTSSVQNIATAITRLVERGADTFLVPNLPNLGLLPRNLGDPILSAAATQLSLAFNSGLATVLTTLENDLLPFIDIIPIDSFALTTEITTNPTEFGFSNVKDPLIGAGLIEDPGFIWWDQQHPTTAVHSLLADVMQRTLFEAGYLVPVASTPLIGAGISSPFPVPLAAEPLLTPATLTAGDTGTSIFL